MVQDLSNDKSKNNIDSTGPVIYFKKDETVPLETRMKTKRHEAIVFFVEESYIYTLKRHGQNSFPHLRNR